MVGPSVGDDFGRYRLTRELGRGGMGVVFAAHDPSLDREVALKIISPQYAADDDFRARFRREALALSRIDSPHVVAVHDHGEHDGSLFLVTQLVPGGDLMQHVRRMGALAPDVAIDLTEQVLAGLADAHGAGIVHRDVKPSNVLLRSRDGRLEAVLCDFGIATTTDDQVTRTGSVVGSFPYMAPERHQGEPADGAADVYSVGCLMWFVLTGTPPYAGSDVEVALAHLQAPIPQLPTGGPQAAAAAAVNDVLTRSMAKRPDDRYRSARAMRADVAALAPVVGGAAVALPDVTSVRHVLTPGVVTVVPGVAGAATPASRRRRRATLVAGLATALVVAAGGTYAAVTAASDDPPPGTETVADVTPGSPVDTSTTGAATTGPAAPTGPGTMRPGSATDATPGRSRSGSGGGSTGSGGTDGGSYGGGGTTDPGAGGSGGSGGSGSGGSGSGGSGSGGSGSGGSGSGGSGGSSGSGGSGSGGSGGSGGGGSTPSSPAPTSSAPAPAPRAQWRCWNGATKVSYSDCSLPTGRAGLRWVFGDINNLSCVNNGSTGDGRRGGLNCTLATGKGKVTVVFMEWTSSAKARESFRASAEPQDWNSNWGKQFFWNTKTAGFQHAKVYYRVPFSMKIDADTLEQRKAAIAKLTRFRKPDRLRADPI